MTLLRSKSFKPILLGTYGVKLAILKTVVVE